MVLVVIGSMSPPKIKGTTIAFEEYFKYVNVKPCSISSGVNPFPTTEEETLEGSINRAKEAQQIFSEANYAVGIESGYMKVLDWWIVRTYATVIHDDTIGIGISAGYEAPESLIRLIKPDDDSSRLFIDEYFGSKDVLHNEGIIGILTEKRLDRTECSKDAVICALARFINSSFY